MMYKFILLIFFITLFDTKASFSKNDSVNMSVETAFATQNLLHNYNNLRSHNKSNVNIKLGYAKKNLSSQLSLNLYDNNKLSFDNSYINYQKGIFNLNIGKIDRIWSFSDKSSLILSSNARPLEAVSLKFENNFNANWLPTNSKFSIEVLNASTKGSYQGNDSVLSGARILISPLKNLDFEIFQTSQWDRKNNKINPSTIGSIILGNTNEGPYANINRMAGFGVSYSIPTNENNYRIYGQAVGEDEAGNLPSCFAWMSGIELSLPNIKLPTITTFELIDTRVPYSTNGNCGPNTMYGNSNYKYTNYGTILGAPIDTESTSLEIFGKTKLSENLNFHFSKKIVTINDKNYTAHRLSKKRSSGSIISLGISWVQKNFNVAGNISYQNLTLDQKKIAPGIIFSIISSMEF